MLRFTRLIAVSAKRTVQSSRAGKKIVLVPLGAKSKNALAAPLKALERIESGKHAAATFMLPSKDALSITKKAATKGKRRTKRRTAAVKLGVSRGAKKSLTLSRRLLSAGKSKRLAKGKARRGKTAKLVPALKGMGGLKKRVKAASGSLKGRKRQLRKAAQKVSSLKKAAQKVSSLKKRKTRRGVSKTKHVAGGTKGGVRKAFRRVSRAKKSRKVHRAAPPAVLVARV